MVAVNGWFYAGVNCVNGWFYGVNGLVRFTMLFTGCVNAWLC